MAVWPIALWPRLPLGPTKREPLLKRTAPKPEPKPIACADVGSPAGAASTRAAKAADRSSLERGILFDVVCARSPPEPMGCLRFAVQLDLRPVVRAPNSRPIWLAARRAGYCDFGPIKSTSADCAICLM